MYEFSLNFHWSVSNYAQGFIFVLYVQSIPRHDNLNNETADKT